MKQKFTKVAFLGVVALLFAFIFSMIISTSSVIAADTSAWKWTAENPKPAWFEFGEKNYPGTPTRGGTFKTAAPRYVGLMNPNHWPVNDWVAMTYIYEYLIRNDGEFKPTANWLIENWKYTGPTSAVMKFRKGIQFHDGTELTAITYKYQLDWIKNPASGAWSKAWIAPIKSTKVIDKYTLEFKFTKPWAAFAGIMANVPGYVISQKALEGDVALSALGKVQKKINAAQKKVTKAQKKADKASGSKKKKELGKLKKEQKKLAKLEKELAKFKQQAEGAKPLDKFPVSTGRFMLEEGRPGNYLKLKRNPNWWFAKTIGTDAPYFDGITINIIPDSSVRLANFRAGKLDSISIIRAQYNLLKNDRNAKVYTYVGNHQAGLAFNHAKGPTKDIRVRKAISHAIDRRALIAGTQFGLAVEASSMYPVVHWGHNPNLEPVKYDPELSKKLLAEAGYANGLVLKGDVSNLQESMTWTAAVKNMLKKVGIDWQFDSLDAVARDDRMKNLEFDLRQGGWTWILDPDLMATGLYHPDGNFNQGRVNLPEVTALIEKGRKELDLKKRRQIYWKIEDVIYNNYVDVWLWWPKDMTVFRSTVKGYNPELYLAGREAYWHSHNFWFEGGKR